MSRTATHKLALCAMVAALYAVLSYFGGIFGLTYGPIQFRFAEALCVLPFLFPVTAPGLFVGCVIANLLSPYGMLDVVFGSTASLLAALWTARMPNRWLAPLPPVICNGVILGILFAAQGTMESGGPFLPAFLYNGFTVALGELGACYVLGSILLVTLPKIPYFRTMMPQRRLEKLPL